MQKDRWKEITRIFHAALELPPEQRPGFVSTAASSDPELQSEVERLLLADELASSYLESPLLPSGALTAPFSAEPELSPGQILCQRFHILRAVGSGGMGQVFEAHDTELGVNVALKLIRPEIATNPQTLARFRQEVRLARRITHPNVCRTYDLDRDSLPAAGGEPRTLVFLTMEFLEGETLAARLKRFGRLPFEEILVVARQIAAALDAAHALGIVHRDIKPGNIMLVPAGENSRQPARAVVTDFGLARLDPSSGPLLSPAEDSISYHGSHSHRPIGTLAYMAPEQMDGSPVSAATDVYAFGLLLFEMATGRRAFPSSNLLSGIAQRLSGPLPSPTSLEPSLPESLERAVQGCLRLKPQERFLSAHEAFECLAGQPGEWPAYPSQTFAKGTLRIPDRARGARKLSLAVAVSVALAVAVSLFLLGLRYPWWEGNARLDSGALVYLAPVINQTGDRSLDDITELLRASLEQSAQINLLDQGRAGDILEQMKKSPDTRIDQTTARHIAMRANAARVVLATLTRSGSKSTLDIDIQRPDYYPGRFREHWMKHFDWQSSGATSSAAQSGSIPPELTAALRKATNWIRQEVGESQNDIGRLDTAPEDATTGSWAAFQKFNQAIQLHRTGNSREAIEQLEQAVQIDPDFALAYARLGDMQCDSGNCAEGLRSYAKALDLAEMQRLTPREGFRIRGLAASDSGDLQTAEEAFREYTRNYPTDYLGWFYLGYTLIGLGRDKDGLDYLRHSYQLNSATAATAAQLGMFEAALGNSAEAAQVANHLRELSSPAFAAYIDGLSAFLQGDTETAGKDFAEAGKLDTAHDPFLGASLLAHLAAEQGKFAEAAQILTQGIEQDHQAGSASGESAKLLDRAAMEEKMASYPAMLQDIQAALKLNQNPASIDTAAFLLGQAAEKAPHAATAEVRAELAALDRQYAGDELGNSSKVAKLHLHAEVLLLGRRWDSALSEARKAEALDAPANDRSHWAFLLRTVAENTADPARSRSLKMEASKAYGHTVLAPGVAWKSSYGSPAGFLADEMTAYMDLASQLRGWDDTVARVQISLRHLRAQSHP